MSKAQYGGERTEIESFPWPYRRIATEEAFSLPEVYEAMRGWAATADPAEPDQDFWDFVCRTRRRRRPRSAGPSGS